MSRTRRKRDTNAPRPELTRPQPARKTTAAGPSLAGTGIPEWKWRTTPVALMFSLGGLIGTFGGAAAIGANSEAGLLVIMGAFALIFGASLGRVVRRHFAIRKLQKIRAA